MVNVTTDPTKEARKIANKAFVKRLHQACDAIAGCPPDYGRQKWVLDKYNTVADTEVSAETMRKWFHGESRPSRLRLIHLARAVQASAVWLEMGQQPDSSLREDSKRKVVFDGAVHVLAGFIQLSGGKAIFPDPTKPSRLVPEGADISAIVSDELHHFRAALAREAGPSKVQFVVPANLDGLTVIGVVPVTPLRVEFLHLTPELIAKHATHKGGFSEVVAVRRDGSYSSGRDEWRKVRSFAERL